jgi:hypothetical protein
MLPTVWPRAYIRNMRRPKVLPPGLLFLFSFCVYSAPVRAQLPVPSSPCSSASAKAHAEPPKDERDGSKVVIDDVMFDGPIHALPSIVDEAIDEAKHLDFDANSDWINELAEVSIRGRWQNYGYFRANASATAERLGGDSNEQHFRVIVHLDEGCNIIWAP